MATGGQKTVGYSLAKVGTLTLETAGEFPCYISIVVCQDKIVVLDMHTYKVNIHGLHDGKFLASSGSLESRPRDMCLMDAMTICVIHYRGLIKMMSIDSTDMSRYIKTTKTLRIQGVLLDEYHGVVRFKDNLLVTGEKQGMMYWCIVSLQDGHVDKIHQICKGDLWCSVTTKDNIIYISCYAGYKSPDNTGVYGFDILNPSQCKYKYKHQRLQSPSSIVINEDGNIFVCNYGYPDYCIHQLTASCQLVAIFTQGLPLGLRAIFWDNGLLYGTCLGSPDITVFRAVYQVDKDPWYRSIVVRQDKIVVLDRNTSKVNIHGLHDGKFLASSGSLESRPRDMCLMDAMTICVIHRDGLIKMMSIDSTDMSRYIKTTKTLRLQGVLLDEYHGVVRFKDSLVVTGVKQGMMYWCIVSLKDGHVDRIHQICKGYGWCRVTTKDTIIYISCHSGVTFPDNTGVFGFDILNPSQCKYKYKHQRLQRPTSIVINEDGNIFVCNNGLPDSCIHQLTASCQLVAIFTQGIPWSLYAIFWDNGHLYGTWTWRPDVTVFRHVYQGSHKASEVLVSDERKQPVIEETAIQIGQGNVPGYRLEEDVASLTLEDNAAKRKGKQQQIGSTVFGSTSTTQATGFIFGGTGSGTGSGTPDKEERAVKPTYVDSIAEKKQRSVLSSGKDELDQRKDEIVDILFQRFSSYAFAAFLLEIKADKTLEYVFSYILKTKHREALCMTLDKIQEYWRKHFHDSHLVLWVGSNYNKGDEEHTLVCYHLNDIPSEDFISHCLGLPVLYRHFHKIEREPLEIRIHQKYQHMSLSNTQKCLIEKLIQIHSEELFSKHSNLEAISASSVISSKRRGLVEKTSIILYCRLKGVIPFGESFFPRELNIEDQVFPTDVREGFFSFGMNGGAVNAGRPSPREYINPLKIGCSVGNYNLNCAGTLGPFVRIPNGSKGFLTCAHVFGVTSTSGSNQIFAVQPGNGEAGQQRGREARQCGVLEDVVFDSNGAVGIDAALVQIDDSRRNIDPTGFVWNHSSELERAGFSETYPPSFQHGSVLERLDFETAAHNRVIKCGRTTGLTKGSVALHGCAVRIHDASLNLPNGMTMHNQITHIMKGQYIVESNGNLPFFSDGDSGSGVYLVQREKRLALVGIAIGSLTVGECVVTPIGAVLNALSLNSDDVMMDDDMDAN